MYVYPPRPMPAAFASLTVSAALLAASPAAHAEPPTQVAWQGTADMGLLFLDLQVPDDSPLADDLAKYPMISPFISTDQRLQLRRGLGLALHGTVGLSYEEDAPIFGVVAPTVGWFHRTRSWKPAGVVDKVTETWDEIRTEGHQTGWSSDYRATGIVAGPVLSLNLPTEEDMVAVGWRVGVQRVSADTSQWIPPNLHSDALLKPRSVLTWDAGFEWRDGPGAFGGFSLRLTHWSVLGIYVSWIPGHDIYNEIALGGVQATSMSDLRYAAGAERMSP